MEIANSMKKFASALVVLFARVGPESAQEPETLPGMPEDLAVEAEEVSRSDFAARSYRLR